MIKNDYTKEELVDAIMAARASYIPWAHILTQEIDRLTIELTLKPKKEEEKKPLWEFPHEAPWGKYTLDDLYKPKKQ
jgi:hypothetical protein